MTTKILRVCFQTGQGWREETLAVTGDLETDMDSHFDSKWNFFDGTKTVLETILEEVYSLSEGFGKAQLIDPEEGELFMFAFDWSAA